MLKGAHFNKAIQLLTPGAYKDMLTFQTILRTHVIGQPAQCQHCKATHSVHEPNEQSVLGSI